MWQGKPFYMWSYYFQFKRKYDCMFCIGKLGEGAVFGVQFYWNERCIPLSFKGWENLEMKRNQGWVSV